MCLQSALICIVYRRDSNRTAREWVASWASPQLSGEFLKHENRRKLTKNKAKKQKKRREKRNPTRRLVAMNDEPKPSSSCFSFLLQNGCSRRDEERKWRNGRKGERLTRGLVLLFVMFVCFLFSSSFFSHFIKLLRGWGLSGAGVGGSCCIPTGRRTDRLTDGQTEEGLGWGRALEKGLKSAPWGSAGSRHRQRHCHDGGGHRQSHDARTGRRVCRDRKHCVSERPPPSTHPAYQGPGTLLPANHLS